MSTITNQVLRKCYPPLWPWPSGYLQRWRFLFKDHAASLHYINLDYSSGNSDAKNTASWLTDQGGTVTLTFRLFHPNRYFSIESFQILSFQCIITKKPAFIKRKLIPFANSPLINAHHRDLDIVERSLRHKFHWKALFMDHQFSLLFSVNNVSFNNLWNASANISADMFDLDLYVLSLDYLSLNTAYHKL